MPDYVLESVPVQLPDRALTLRLTGGDQAAVIEVRSADREVGLSQQGGRQVYLDTVPPDGVTVAVLPQQGQRFPEDARVHLEVSASRYGDPDPDRATLRSAVGGLRRVDLLTITQHHPGWLNLAPSDPEDLGLRGIAGLAQATTVDLLGLTTKQLRGRGRDLSVVVDGSASMRSWVEDGSVGAVLDVVAGVDRVLGREPHLDVRLLAPREGWRRVPPVGAGEELGRAFRTDPARTGANLAGWSPPGDTASVYVTDCAPGVGDPRPDLRVILCRQDARELLARRAHGAPVSFVTRAAPSIPERLADPADELLGSLVRDILTSCLPVAEGNPT